MSRTRGPGVRRAPGDLVSGMMPMYQQSMPTAPSLDAQSSRFARGTLVCDIGARLPMARRTDDAGKLGAILIWRSTPEVWKQAHQLASFSRGGFRFVHQDRRCGCRKAARDR